MRTANANGTKRVRSRRYSLFHFFAVPSPRKIKTKMGTRAKSIKGMLVKARVRKRYKSDDEAREGQILDSIVKDLKRMARKAQS